MAGFAVRNPRGEIVHPYQWQASSDYTDGSSMGGYYAVCIDNQFAKFASKLVNLYLTVIRYDEWEKYTKEIEDLNVNINNFTVSRGRTSFWLVRTRCVDIRMLINFLR